MEGRTSFTTPKELRRDKKVACQNVKNTGELVNRYRRDTNAVIVTDCFDCKQLEKRFIGRELLGYRNVYLDEAIHGD